MEFFVDGGLQKLFVDLNNQQQFDFNDYLVIPKLKNIPQGFTTGCEEVKDFSIYSDTTMGNETPKLLPKFEESSNEISNTILDQLNNSLNNSLDSFFNSVLVNENSSIESKYYAGYHVNQIKSTNGSTSLHDIKFSFDKNLKEWEENFLENYVDISDFVDSLPDRTPLCTNNCEHFLKESSANLKYKSSLDTLTNLTTTTFINKDVSIQNSNHKYLCHHSDCGKVYTKLAQLKAHLRRHVGEKPYVCKWPSCTWKFSRSDELSRHNRSHSGIKPYKCVYCDKCFARSDHLSKHRKVHERRLLAVANMGEIILNGDLPLSILNVRPGRKKKIKIEM